mgnify:CR=1 FL=1
MKFVLVQGMEMPENCGKCKLAYLTNYFDGWCGDLLCCAGGQKLLEDENLRTRPDWCPLVEMEE